MLSEDNEHKVQVLSFDDTIVKILQDLDKVKLFIYKLEEQTSWLKKSDITGKVDLKWLSGGRKNGH
ncbi:MAG: hypothetical protein ACTSRA_00630 [Promethearchaeota archaeon]